MPWAYDEAIVVKADDDVLKYVLESGKGYPVEITQIQLSRNIWKLLEKMDSQRLSKNPELLDFLANAQKEHRDSMGLESDILSPGKILGVSKE